MLVQAQSDAVIAGIKQQVAKLGNTALTGYGLGIGLVTLMISLARYRLPNYAAMISFRNLGLALIMVLVIVAISSYFGVRKVLKIEPFDIFRG